MAKPELKQYGDLTREDFERCPVWIGCHNADYDEPWYDDTNEETFRPWTDDLPADASKGMLLVRATIELRDGSRHPGFVTPSQNPGEDLGTQQPQIFASDRRFGFWGGILGVRVEERQALYAALGKAADAVFPLRFAVDQSLATGNVSGEVNGFYRRLRDRSVQIER
jgi:hypothetical protein